MNEGVYFEHGGNILALARQRGKCYTELLDFSANINPLGLPESVRETLRASIENVVHYPEADAAALKQAISQHYGIAENCITVGNGAAELLYILCYNLKPRRVLLTVPTFSEYERAARAAGADIEYIYLSPDDGFIINIKEVKKQLSGVDIVFICNPNNPTGTLLSNGQIAPLLEAAQECNTIVAVDESFIEFLLDDKQYTCRSFLTQYPNLVILQSLTKFYAIPGLRLGFILASLELTQALHAGKDCWNVNSLAQSAGIAALNDEIIYRTESRSLINTASEQLYAALLTIPGFKPFRPSANFILVNIAGTGMTAGQMSDLMLDNDILIRDCSNFAGLSSEYIRLAVKLPSQNELLIKTIGKILGV